MTPSAWNPQTVVSTDRPYPHILRLSRSFELTPDDQAALDGLVVNTRRVPKDELLQTFRQSDHAVLLLSGLAAQVLITREGDRHVSGFLLPGEISFTQWGSGRKSNFDLLARCDCEAAFISKARLRELEVAYPRLTQFLGWAVQRELDALQNRLMMMCTGSVEDRVMYLVERIYSRLEVIGAAGEGRFRLPIRQYDIADAVGASKVHISRSLTQLRKKGYLQAKRFDGTTEFQLLRWTDAKKNSAFTDAFGNPVGVAASF